MDLDIDNDNDKDDESIDQTENAQTHVEVVENPAMPADARLEEEPSTQAGPVEEPAGPPEGEGVASGFDEAQSLASERDESQAPSAACPTKRVHMRGYINMWSDITCTRCGAICGQIKLDPGPGGRDSPTWYSRVKLADGSWPSKGRYFTRRSINTVGESDEFSRAWIADWSHCHGIKRAGLEG